MKNFLLRLFGKKPPGPPHPTPQTVAEKKLVRQDDASAVATNIDQRTVEMADWEPGFDLGAQFLLWLLGDQRYVLDDDIEKTILIGLEKLRQSELAGANLIPRVPSVLPQLLKSLRDENASGAELAQFIGKDVLLVAELITEVNSSYYNPASKITSLDNAIRMLGINGLRMLVARVAFRPLIQLQTGVLTKHVAPLLWEQSDKCAHACRLLAQERQLEAFHGFLAGLLKNVGLIIAFRTVDQLTHVHQLPVSAHFRQVFMNYAQTLSYRIGQQWAFPDAVLEAIANQSLPPVELNGLSLVLHQATQLSKLRMLVNDGKLREQDTGLLAPAYQGLYRCFSALNEHSS
ncbi:MAG: HDOD domain-containing protein [Burkholderiales bacterium]|nr:HDOD domain-containing protein [Burkholderiales bacterium]